MTTHDRIIELIKLSGKRGVTTPEICLVLKLKHKQLDSFLHSDDLIYENDEFPTRYFYAGKDSPWASE